MISTAGCATDSSVESNILKPSISPSVLPGISINSVPPIAICEGTSVTFTTTSTGTGSTPGYQWYKNNVAISGANNASYTDAALVHGDTLTVSMTTSALCATSPTANSNKVGVEVRDMVTPKVDIEVSPSEVVVPGQPLTFTVTPANGGASPDYQWLKNGVDIPFETGDTYTSSTLQPGDHISVRMLSYEPCVDQPQATSNEIILKGSLGIRPTAGAAGNVKLYPNPSSGRFTVSVSSATLSVGAKVSLDVINVLGQVVHHAELIPSGANWQTQIDLDPGLAGGNYLLRMSSEDASVDAAVPFVLNR